MLAALLALLASVWLAPVVAFIEHDPCPRGCIVAPGVFYQITRDDLVWTARMVSCEVAEVLDTDEAPATMWSIVTNWTRRREAGRVESLGSFAASYSGCTSRRWADGGDLYSPRITPLATANRRTRWNDIRQDVRDFVHAFFRAEYTNRWPGFCWIFTAGWEDRADRRWIGPFRVVRDSGRSLNSYWKDRATKDWTADRIRIVRARPFYD